MSSPTIRFEEDLEDYMQEHDLNEYEILIDLEPKYGDSSVTARATMWSTGTEPREEEHSLETAALEPEEAFDVWRSDLEKDHTDIDWV
ncbi:MAG: hypothetical protein ABEJ91_03920 [Candidatus Nanohaloarchaea archaeon]